MLQRALHPPTASLLVALASAGFLAAALALEYLAALPPCRLPCSACRSPPGT